MSSFLCNLIVNDVPCFFLLQPKFINHSLIIMREFRDKEIRVKIGIVKKRIVGVPLFG
jgi:hypothetical protein